MSAESADRVYKYDDYNDGGDDDVVDIKRDDDSPDGDNIEHAANQSVFTSPKKSSEKRKHLSFTGVCAESSKKSNEMFEQRFIGSESLPGNDVVQSVAKDVSDEECLMQCVEFLNKMSTESADRVYKYDDDNDGADDDVVDIKRDDDGPDGDNIEHAANQSVFTSPMKSSEKRKRSSFTDVWAESSKKSNEIFEQRFIGSESLPGNDVVQSVAKDVSDEECLMQCVEILNKMEEIDDDSYSKALKLFHDVPTWRKIFVVMPDQRRKNFILKL